MYNKQIFESMQEHLYESGPQKYILLNPTE